jgi:hypothetical protein
MYVCMYVHALVIAHYIPNTPCTALGELYPRPTIIRCHACTAMHWQVYRCISWSFVTEPHCRLPAYALLDCWHQQVQQQANKLMWRLYCNQVSHSTVSNSTCELAMACKHWECRVSWPGVLALTAMITYTLTGRPFKSLLDSADCLALGVN